MNLAILVENPVRQAVDQVGSRLDLSTAVTAAGGACRQQHVTLLTFNSFASKVLIDHQQVDAAFIGCGERFRDSHYCSVALARGSNQRFDQLGVIVIFTLLL
jgi:hypothetical protein